MSGVRWQFDLSVSDRFGRVRLRRATTRAAGRSRGRQKFLSRRRALTVDMIHKISATWKIPADLLVRRYRIERAA